MIFHVDSIETSNELISVFIHEMGHIVDLGVLQGKKGRVSKFRDGNKAILADDKSLLFYKISWKDGKTRLPHATQKDFISGYAMYSPFEDFAEAYIFYRLHGEKFRQIAKESPALKRKYSFFKKNVFDGEEFQTDKPKEKFVHGVLWDATLLSIDKPIQVAQQ